MNNLRSVRRLQTLPQTNMQINKSCILLWTRRPILPPMTIRKRRAEASAYRWSGHVITWLHRKKEKPHSSRLIASSGFTRCTTCARPRRDWTSFSAVPEKISTSREDSRNKTKTKMKMRMQAAVQCESDFVLCELCVRRRRLEPFSF